MKFRETILKGAYIIEIETINDGRGFFARSFCQREFEQIGLNADIVQCNLSYNRHKGTLRGMHFQKKPFEEVKLVHCTKGAIYDVIIDLRIDSPHYCRWFSIILRENENRMLYIPEGFAHGFQTLENDTCIFYQMSEFYQQESASGVRWNDPCFSIEWPIINNIIISDKDMSYPDFIPNK